MWGQKIESYLHRSYLLPSANLQKMYQFLSVFPTMAGRKGERSAEQKQRDKHFTPLQLLHQWRSRVALLPTSSQPDNVAEILAESLYLIQYLQYLDLEQTRDFPKALSCKNGARQAGQTFPGSGSQAPDECWRFGHGVSWRFNPQRPTRLQSAVAVWCRPEPLPHVCLGHPGWCLVHILNRGQVGADSEHFSGFPGGVNAACPRTTAWIARVWLLHNLEVRKSELEAWQ